MRTVEIHKHDEFDEVTQNHAKQVCAVIGYLCMWAIHSEKYCHLTLYCDKEGNVNATYRNKDKSVTYSMFGLRGDDGTYSTHS